MHNRFRIVLTEDSNRDLIEKMVASFNRMTEKQRKNAPVVVTKKEAA